MEEKLSLSIKPRERICAVAWDGVVFARYFITTTNNNMNIKYLIYGLAWLIFAFVWYRIHQWWFTIVKSKSQMYFKPMIYLRVVGNWALLIISVILSIVYFFKSFN